MRQEDRTNPTQEESTLPTGLDADLRKAADALAAKGKGIGKTSKKRAYEPDPAR